MLYIFNSQVVIVCLARVIMYLILIFGTSTSILSSFIIPFLRPLIEAIVVSPQVIEDILAVRFELCWQILLLDPFGKSEIFGIIQFSHILHTWANNIFLEES